MVCYEPSAPSAPKIDVCVCVCVCVVFGLDLVATVPLDAEGMGVMSICRCSYAPDDGGVRSLVC